MTKRNSRPAVPRVRSLKGESRTNLPSLSKARLKELIEQAIVDAYGEEEQAGGFFTMIEEHLALPFPVKVLWVCYVPSRRGPQSPQRASRTTTNGET
jgi:hypothetical protein